MSRKTQKQLLAEAKELGIVIEGKLKNAEIKELIVAAQEADNSEEPEGNSDVNNSVLLFDGEEYKKSGNLLRWEGQNNVKVLEVLVDGGTLTLNHCRVLDSTKNALTMHVPVECFTNLPSLQDEEDEDE